MVVKKEQPQVFEYFKTSEVTINGRFKEYVDKMWVQNKVQESMVRRLVDLYAIAAVIGLRMKRRLPDDRAGDDTKRTIQMMQLTDTYQTLAPIMKLVLMLDESRGLNEEERIRSAFRIPETREEHDAGMELFNSYARGGIEYMYEMLVIRPGDPDDEYGDQRINNIVALLKDPMECSKIK